VQVNRGKKQSRASPLGFVKRNFVASQPLALGPMNERAMWCQIKAHRRTVLVVGHAKWPMQNARRH